ncbi:MAG: sigma factor-like helix-turn-helix DNA-binding protein [Candidatus Komeilibacteria bacterium]
MESTNSILDKVISSQTAEDIANFEPSSILNLLFSNLSDREKDVIVHRYGLDETEAKTLEEIGKLFDVTRERIRQIENSTIKKIRNHPEIEERLKPVENMISDILEEHGGVMREDALYENILNYGTSRNIDRAATSFIISKLLDHKLDKVVKHKKIHDSWKLPTAEVEFVEELIDDLVDILKDRSEPLPRRNILEKIQKRPIAEKYSGKLNDKVVQNALDLTTKINNNPFDEWGLADWRSIKPKRMNDKISLVMRKAGKPMHFTEIADKINEAKFDNKTAYPATIHNELILDDQYVLVGRGIYALKEWGYQPGVVADVITSVMEEAGKPLTKSEIIERVLDKRMVKQSTIQLALMNKKRFKRVEKNKYWIAD